MRINGGRENSVEFSDHLIGLVAALFHHKTISMIDKHYYDKAITWEEAKDTFSVFKLK